MPETNYTSGMNNSFSQSVPGAKAPPKVPTTAPATTAPATSNAAFSKPAQPATPVTSGVTAAASPVKPAQQSLPLNMKITLPEGFGANLGNTLGAIGSAGVYAYGQATSPWGALTGIKNYLRQPQNFANTMGALSPIASPLLRAGGLPLMLGAYSMLNDPTYAKTLSNGMLPKLGAVTPGVMSKPPEIPNFRAPDVLGAGSSAGQVSTPGALKSLPSQTTVLPTTPQTSAGTKVTAGLGTGGALTSMAAGKLAGKGAGKLLGPGVDIAMDAANVLGLGRAIDGQAALPWRETAAANAEDTNPVNWLAKYKHITNDKATGAGGKALGYALHTLNNPLLAPMTQPISTGLTAAKAVEDAKNSLGAIGQMGQTSNRGLAPRIR